MWYPRKAAFRAGFVDGTQWDDASVGLHSVAIGYDNVASGVSSLALGRSTTASGSQSTALSQGTVASGSESTAIGQGTTATASYSTAIGLLSTASGVGAIALGYHTSASGFYSTSMGSSASTYAMDGSFVYGDFSTSVLLLSSTPNQFSVRAAGGYRFFTNAGMSLGAVLGPNQGSWSALSDRNRKSRFLAVRSEEILGRVMQVPVSTWIHRDQPDPSVRHIGPMAQDWRTAFGFSPDSTTINSGDFDGVNLASIQALTVRTDQLRSENAGLRGANAAMQSAAAVQDRRITTLEAANAALQIRLDRIEASLSSSSAHP